ncbi:MAG: glycosyltransferase [Pseudomonadota bacterium]
MSQRCAVVLWSAASAADQATRYKETLKRALPDWAELPGPDATIHESPQEALAAGLAAGCDVLVLEAGTALPPMALERLYRCLEAQPDAQVVSAVRPEWLTTSWPMAETDSALWWATPRLAFPYRDINPACCLWPSPDSKTVWPDRTADSSQAQHRLACSHLLVGPAPTETKPPNAVDPRDRPAAAPLDQLNSRLWEITEQTPALPLPYAGLDAKPVVLHILHSWGGGTARWAADTADAWDSAWHLFLLSFANPGDASQGQELRLHPGSLDAPCVARWALPIPIAGSVVEQSAYRQVLDAICSTHGVTALVVSSLIGHSVEALETGLPTLAMLHDYYPAWPDLGLLFESSAADFSDDRLPEALAHSHFHAMSPERWRRVRARWLAALKGPQVAVLAPSDTVRANLERLVDSDALPEITTVSHGLVPFEHSRQPQTFSGGPRWRLVVPGRISDQKGAGLLREALPELTRFADVYLLGGSKFAEAFYGCNHVHIILEYQLDELPALLDEIRPDLALLLSQVSETFNYTLSEMWALNVPVLATRVGALAHRIDHGNTGLLIDPKPDDLVQAIATLDREQLEALRASEKPLLSPQESVARYLSLLPGEETKPASGRYPLKAPTPDDLGSADRARRLHEASELAKTLQAKLIKQQQELEQRAGWASREARRAEEALDWAKSLEQDLSQLTATHQQLQDEFEDRSAWALRLRDETEAQQKRMGQLENQISEISSQLLGAAQELEMVLSTRSWKLTRPLRVAARGARRVLSVFNFHQRRAATLQQRARNSLRVRGVKGTLERIGQELSRGEPAIAPKVLAEIDTGEPFEPLTFTLPDAPKISVVVPTYNHYHHTQACLKSLSGLTDSASFEVIVVDDCSGDETRDRLADHTGLRVLHNEENSGFIDTCNRGADSATGEYLFFLNNDTVVEHGCFDRLLETFAQHSDVGLVGAKLVYPDGRLQEAGGIVFSDGSGWNYGRFENPSAPAVNFVREVDYCSGAAILLRRELFTELGGFDTRYRPAYYEDTDLAFRVREHGLRVLYQPAAQVVHFEGVTSGTDTSSGVKRYQVVNQEKFVDRWREALPHQPDPEGPLDLTRRHRRQRSVLIIDATTPTPDQDSGSVRMVNLMRLLLDLGWHVRFMAENRAFDDRYTAPLQQLGVEVLYHPFIKSAHQYLKEVGNTLDAVILSRHYIASNHIESVRTCCPRALLLFDTVDLHYLREQRLAELENQPSLHAAAAKTRTRELDVARRCDLTLVVSEYEREFLREDAPDIKVSILSNIHPVHGRRKSYEEREGLLFVGGFQHPPNIDGVTWFVREVLPLVHQQQDGIKLTVIGSKMTDAVKALAGPLVDVLGFVEDLEPYLDGCRLSLAPLRYGAGVKGKINMAMSYGQPVVATSPAVEGMHVVPGQEVMVGDSPEDFAAAVLEAYRDPALWLQLSDGGLANVEQHFSFAAARSALKDILTPDS